LIAHLLRFQFLMKHSVERLSKLYALARAIAEKTIS
jgi:hypothetical protein